MLSLSVTAIFYLLESFGENGNIKNFINVWLLEHPIQKIVALTCGHFQLYFYENLFFPDKNSYLHSYKTLSNLAIETLLNKLFTLDQDKNEQIINKYVNRRQIKMT